MSRTRHITIDEAEILETKFEQLEKRLENVERFIFSQANKNSNNDSMPQVLQLLTTLVDRQVSNPHALQQSQQMVSQQPDNFPSNQESNPPTKLDNSVKKSSPLDIGRLRTVL